MTKAFDSAVRLLARREHSALELYNKLKQKGYHATDAQDALDACQSMGLQSDERFVDVYGSSRIHQGYGPLKISQELSGKGISKILIHQFLQQEQDNWLTHALNVWQKKSKGQLCLMLDGLQKQQRFLLYRGFTLDIVTQVKKELGYA